MRALTLRLNDGDLFTMSYPCAPSKYEFLKSHMSAFKRMWEEEGRVYWLRFLVTFQNHYKIVYHTVHELVHLLEPDEHDLLSNLVLINIHKKFMQASYGAVKRFVDHMLILMVNLPLLQESNRIKNPFYAKETREAFRELLGTPDIDEDIPALSVGFMGCIYGLFLATVSTLLKRWLKEPDLSEEAKNGVDFTYFYWKPCEYWSKECFLPSCFEKYLAVTYGEALPKMLLSAKVNEIFQNHDQGCPCSNHQGDINIFKYLNLHSSIDSQSDIETPMNHVGYMHSKVESCIVHSECYQKISHNPMCSEPYLCKGSSNCVHSCEKGLKVLFHSDPPAKFWKKMTVETFTCKKKGVRNVATYAESHIQRVETYVHKPENSQSQSVQLCEEREDMLDILSCPESLNSFNQYRRKEDVRKRLRTKFVQKYCFNSHEFDDPDFRLGVYDNAFKMWARDIVEESVQKHADASSCTLMNHRHSNFSYDSRSVLKSLVSAETTVASGTHCILTGRIVVPSSKPIDSKTVVREPVEATSVSPEIKSKSKKSKKKRKGNKNKEGTTDSKSIVQGTNLQVISSVAALEESESTINNCNSVKDDTTAYASDSVCGNSSTRSQELGDNHQSVEKYIVRNAKNATKIFDDVFKSKNYWCLPSCEYAKKSSVNYCKPCCPSCLGARMHQTVTKHCLPSCEYGKNSFVTEPCCPSCIPAQLKNSIKLEIVNSKSKKKGNKNKEGTNAKSVVQETGSQVPSSVGALVESESTSNNSNVVKDATTAHASDFVCDNSSTKCPELADNHQIEEKNIVENTKGVVHGTEISEDSKVLIEVIKDVFKHSNQGCLPACEYAKKGGVINDYKPCCPSCIPAQLFKAVSNCGGCLPACEYAKKRGVVNDYKPCCPSCIPAQLFKAVSNCGGEQQIVYSKLNKIKEGTTDVKSVIQETGFQVPSSVGALVESKSTSNNSNIVKDDTTAYASNSVCGNSSTKCPELADNHQSEKKISAQIHQIRNYEEFESNKNKDSFTGAKSVVQETGSQVPSSIGALVESESAINNSSIVKDATTAHANNPACGNLIRLRRQKDTGIWKRVNDHQPEEKIVDNQNFEELTESAFEMKERIEHEATVTEMQFTSDPGLEEFQNQSIATVMQFEKSVANLKCLIVAVNEKITKSLVKLGKFKSRAGEAQLNTKCLIQNIKEKETVVVTQFLGKFQDWSQLIENLDYITVKISVLAKNEMKSEYRTYIESMLDQTDMQLKVFEADYEKVKNQVDLLLEKVNYLCQDTHELNAKPGNEASVTDNLKVDEQPPDNTEDNAECSAVKQIVNDEDSVSDAVALEAKEAIDNLKSENKLDKHVEDFLTLIGVLKDAPSKSSEIPDSGASSASKKQDAEVKDKKSKLKTCAFCGKKEVTYKTFKRCAKCKTDNFPVQRYYCSRECQVDDWQESHKDEHLKK